MIQEKKNFVWNLLGLTFNSFNSLFFLIIVKRINGLEITGSFSFAYAVACLLYIVSIYYTRAYQVSNDEYKASDFVYSRCVSCTLMFLISLILCMISPKKIDKFLIVLLCLFRNVEAMADVFYGEFHRENRLDYAGKSLFIKALLGVSLFFITDIYFHSIILAVCSLILVNIIGLVIDYLNYKKYKTIEAFNWKKIYTLFKSSRAIFIFSFVSILLVNMQKYFIPFFEGDSAEAIFSIIIMPGTMMSLCGQYLLNPYMTYFNEQEKEKNYNKIKKRLVYLLIVLGIFSLFASLMLITVGIPILNMIYAMDTKIYRLLFVLVILGAGFYSMSVLISSVLTIMKENSVQLKIYTISTMICLISSYVFIKYGGIQGAVYSYMTTMGIHFLEYLIIFIKRTK